MSDITIYHNPRCSSSRNTLGLIRNSGAEPVIVEYLKTPLTAAELQALLQRMGSHVRDILREKESVYQELDLGNAKWSDADLLGFVEQHPILMNRPIVATPKGVRLCRPCEQVLEILPQAQQGPFTKENGEVVQP
ncbi:arsenate reductase (glutaredoxin) [Brachymonas chironomi]|uniref:arsenate reductase (glutaredoxin) n=1 Tax=Brachymonas chironomi TaxID=491919 RepID=UPI0003798EBC|nr:arsenate reductase (glutaredoxin) [Brachymonas chironomi]